MDSDDPFSNGDGDRTVIRPMPGGRSAAATPRNDHEPKRTRIEEQPRPGAAPAAAGPVPQQAAAYVPLSGQIAGSGLNPLVDAATSLLMLSSQLRNTLSQSNISGLRNHIIQQLRVFEDRARASGCDQETTLTARYILCTMLDESVLSTPWGSESDWASQSLLSTFHNETWGGEKFFQVLDRQIQEPARNLNVLELMYICLAFGFQGKHGVSDRGGTQLLEIQDNLFRTISMQRGDFERELSPHWAGVPDKRYALVKYVPLWVVGALAGVLLLIVYAGFRFILGSTTAPLYEEIDQIKQEQSVQLRE